MLHSNKAQIYDTPLKRRIRWPLAAVVVVVEVENVGRLTKRD